MHKIRKIIFFNIYKMFKISAEKFAKNFVHTIKVNKTDNKSVLWIKMIDIQKKLDVKNICDWLMKKLKANIRLIIYKMNKLKRIKDLDQC